MRTGLDRIVVLSDDSLERGGAAGVAIKSVKMLIDRGHRVSLITGHSDVNPDLEPLGVEIVGLHKQGISGQGSFGSAVNGLYDRAVGNLVAKWVADNDTERTVYHLHNWHKVFSPSIFTALKPIANKLFLSAHDYFLVCPNGAFFNYPRGEQCSLKPMSLACLTTNCDRRKYAHKVWRASRHAIREAAFPLARTSATILAMHEACVPFLKRGGLQEKSIRVLRNPVTPWLSTRVRAEENRDVFFIGRLEEDKGVDVLAEAAARAGFSLTIVGDGPLKEPLMRKFPTHRYLGWAKREQLAELVSKARLVVVPTRWPETFGLVTFEALASGIPVLISRFALVSSEVASRGMAVECDPNDGEGMVDLLRKLLSDDGQIEAMSKRAFSEGPSLFPRPEAWVRSLEDLYEGAVETSVRKEVAPSNAIPAVR